jgi:H+/Cl- antiporter ClcA
MKKHKNLKLIVLELVVLGMVVGFIPELVINGARDVWGVCGFESSVCKDIEIQGAFQLFGALICNFVALVLSFIISKEFNSKEK